MHEAYTYKECLPAMARAQKLFVVCQRDAHASHEIFERWTWRRVVPIASRFTKTVVLCNNSNNGRVKLLEQLKDLFSFLIRQAALFTTRTGSWWELNAFQAMWVRIGVTTVK